MSRRVRKGVITRLIGKWLKAGVWEKAEVSYPEEAPPGRGDLTTAQCLVPDKWFAEFVQPECQGGTFMVRHADDFVTGLERLEDVHKV